MLLRLKLRIIVTGYIEPLITTQVFIIHFQWHSGFYSMAIMPGTHHINTLLPLTVRHTICNYAFPSLASTAFRILLAGCTVLRAVTGYNEQFVTGSRLTAQVNKAVAYLYHLFL
jgi:hypothetical protein